MADAHEIIGAVEQLGKMKKLNPVQVDELVKAGIVAALAKKFGPNVEAEITIDYKDKAVDVIVLKKVVAEVEDPANEIALEDARMDDPEFEVGDVLEIEVDFSDFGRYAVMAAKQRILEGVRQGARARIREEYEDQVGELVTGEITAISRNQMDVLVNKDKDAEAILPKREQNVRERYRQGEAIRAVLKDIHETTRGPKLILSRAAPEFVAALFKLEVPEIQQGFIEVKAVVREVGGRTKIAVSSRDEAIDAVGTCVGIRGARVQAVVSELGGERIDIIPWHPDPEVLVKRALAPANVRKAFIDDSGAKIIAIVDDDQLSLAIGKRGQNVRLASQLAGWELDVYSARQWLEEQESEILGGTEDEWEFQDFSVSQLGLSKDTVRALEASGYDMFSTLLDVELEDLLAIEGIDATEAKAVLTVIDDLTE